MNRIYYIECEIYNGNIKCFTDMIVKSENELEARKKVYRYVQMEWGFGFGCIIGDIKCFESNIFIV